MKPLIPLLLLACSLQASALTPREGIDFLYSTMSLPDKADYPREFYMQNIESSFRARSEMPWGDSVPDREFLHFVLPVRVNNENLDLSRPAFYEELKDRVKGLSMKDAILEVNHWCHEKVTYRPSDGRTSSPLSSVSQAIGRCGEESTFTVAALRAVGIPARQIYTPRWAHTDDNHAWVEAWADGKWYFLGACEPEPVLDLAWFNDPASRGLLMNTNVAGDYRGPEEVLLKEPLTTRINVTANYAPVGILPVRTVYKDGSPAKGAQVNFCIYNYAEFYRAVAKTADNEGRASLKAGLGDMLVWASDGTMFGFAKAAPGEGEITIVLDKDADSEGSFTFDITPPRAGSSLPAVTESQRNANTLRLQQEDSIRNAYMATFATPESAAAAAGRLGIDSEKLIKILTEARGNHKALTECLEKMGAEDRAAAVDLLMNVSEKDRRDIPTEVIIDNVANAPAFNKGGTWSREVYNKYILSPRIENEWLTPWRSALLAGLDRELFSGSPEKLIAWIDANIAPADSENPQKLRMSPASVLRERKADRLSRNIFFVAAARTLGMPARIDPVTAATQYMRADGNWETARFASEKKDSQAAKAASPGTGMLMLTFKPVGHIVDPKYYSQFSVSRIARGVAQQLEFDENGTLSEIFKEPVALEAGQYILTSGQRLADGGVLSQSEIFTITPGENVVKELTIRQDDSALSVIGSLNAENIYHDIATDADKSILSTTGRGFYVLGLISPNHEPSAHALNDISAAAAQLEGTGSKIMLLFDDEAAASRFKREAFPGLPGNVVIGIDNGGVSRSELISSLNLDESPAYPLFVVADTFNRVVWVSTGYTIGMGDKILSVLSRIHAPAQK